MRTIVFTFWGRRPNIEIQLPLLQRILDQHPQAELHAWNLARNEADAEYIKSISGDRITIRTEYHWGLTYGRTFTPLEPVFDIYRRYSTPEYDGCTFVKVDDDVVFLETGRFAAFLDAVHTHSGCVVSADVINNEAACAATQPDLWPQFEQLGIPVHDFHRSIDMADTCHQHFFDNHADMLGQPIELVPTETWLSVNAIGYDWATAQAIAARINQPAAPTVAEWETWNHRPATVGGRPWENSDEAILNLFPRIVMRGFTAAHLSFGGQDHAGKQRSGADGHEHRLTGWRRRYGDIGSRYLRSASRQEGHRLPDLSPCSAVDWNHVPAVAYG